MKVTPPNQSLILASELASGGAPDSPLDQPARLTAGGTALKRVTILAARTVVVQADYFSRAETLVNPRAAIEHVPRFTGIPIPFGATVSSATPSSVATVSSRNPVQLYARTQRHDEKTPPLLDVFA
ncbi:MAG TPA: hypothetical protein VGI51_04345 [Steroidobacteraceae bacterium]